MNVERVDFVSVATRETARAVDWHRDVPGLPESRVTGGEIETPNVTLSFCVPEREGLPFRRERGRSCLTGTRHRGCTSRARGQGR
jgi:hypothetical protein